MDNKSNSSIPQGLRSHSGSFKATPIEKDEVKVAPGAQPHVNKQAQRKDLNNDFYEDEQRFGGNLNHNGDDPDKVPVVPSLSDDEVPNLPGAILKHAREMLGLSQREIALRLKLRVNTISDIEHDRLTQPTAAPFARGYIADYARLVNIDPKAVVDLYNHNVLETAEMAKNQNKVGAKKRITVSNPQKKTETKDAVKEEKTASLQDAPVSGNGDKSNKGMLVKLGAVILVLVLAIAAVWLFMSDDAEQNAASGTVSISEAPASSQDNNAASGELIINESSTDSNANEGYQDLLNAPDADPFAKEAAAKTSDGSEELLISPSPAASDSAQPSETLQNATTEAKTSTEMELVVAPSPAADDAAKAAQEQELQAKQAAEEKLKQEQARLQREAEEKLRQEALKKEEEAKKAAAESPKLGANLSDISAQAKLTGREGLASLNNVSVRVKAPVSLRITDSRGKVLVNGSYKAGDRVSATGIPPLKVSVTDTSSVTVNYMGGTIAVPAVKQATFTLPNR